MTTKNSSNKSSAMAALMASHKELFKTLRKGELVKGKITKLTAHEILVDLGAKTEALVLEKDKHILHTLLSTFKVGDTVEVSVLNPESESGNPVVSLRRFLGNISWGKLGEFQKNREALEVVVEEISRAGYVVNTPFGVPGFLPQSRMSFSQNQSVTVGSKVWVIPFELSRADNKVIFSQQSAVSEEVFKEAEKQFKQGDKVEVVVSNVSQNGLVVALDASGSDLQLEGTIHISEVSWDKIASLGGVYLVGQKIEAVVVRFDFESRKVILSVKRLESDPFEQVMAKYPVEKQVSGSVKAVEDSGLVVELEDGVEGVVRKEKVPPTIIYKVGQKVSLIVSEYDKKRKKVVLVPVLLEKPIGYR